MKLPSGWRVRSVGDLFEVQLGKMLNEEAKLGDFQAPYLTNFNVQWGRFKLDSLNRMSFSSRDREKFALKRGDLIMCEGGEVGRCAIWKEEVTPCFYQKALHRLRPRNRQIIPEFMLAYMRFISGTKRLSDLTSQSSIAHLTLEKLVDLDVHVPPIQEQRKIADILTTWDEALEKLDALIEAQERRKKALMQQLLTGKKRFPGFKGKWKKAALGDVAENVADANKGRMGTTSLYGVTKADGVVPMCDHVKGVSFNRCKRVETDWFAYNPMRINIGSIARWQGTETVMVSGDYVVFRCHPDKLLPAYLDHLRQSWLWESFVTRGGNGSVRIRIYFSDLAEFTFLCPPLEEQRQIAAILDTADQQITILRAQRAAIDHQKRGLMQRLLTGKVRVIPKAA